jgi:hypothetical protein
MMQRVAIFYISVRHFVDFLVAQSMSRQADGLRDVVMEQ